MFEFWWYSCFLWGFISLQDCGEVVIVTFIIVFENFGEVYILRSEQRNWNWDFSLCWIALKQVFGIGMLGIILYVMYILRV